MNSEKTGSYPFTVSVNNCAEICNTIDDPYARVCVRNKVKNMNVKVFNLMSWVNETKPLVQHQSYEYKCRLNDSVCNSKQKRYHDKCWCEWKELDDRGSCKHENLLNDKEIPWAKIHYFIYTILMVIICLFTKSCHLL